MLPPSFQSLQGLAQLTSLRRISARASESCNVGPLVAMPQLETLLLGGNSDFQEWVGITELGRDFDVSVDPTGRYMQLLIEGGASAFNPEFDLENLGGIYDSPIRHGRCPVDLRGHRRRLRRDYFRRQRGHRRRFIQQDLLARSVTTWTGWGRQFGRRQVVIGSAGRLRGVVTIPAIDGLWQGPDSGPERRRHYGSSDT